MHLLRGTPYIYQGEEIGMIDPNYEQISDYVDVETHNAYHELKKHGVSEQDALAIIQAKSRDNSRTPMHWDSGPNAGFTTGTPWLKPKDQERINVAAELDHGEIFSYYQKLIYLRKQLPIIAKGSYQPVDLDHPQVFVYRRDYNGQTLLVISNFYDHPVTYQLPEAFQGQKAETLITNYEQNITEVPNALNLQPYEAIALLI